MTTPSDSESPKADPRPYVKPHHSQLRQYWPLDGGIRAQYIEHLREMTLPGAMIDDRHPDGTPYKRQVTVRETVRFIKLLKSFGQQALAQQKLDREDEDEANREQTLNDFVTPAMELAGQRMSAEATAQGLDCAAALPTERKDAIFAQAHEECRAAGNGKSERRRKGVVEAAPAQRNDWIIPKATQDQVMARLVDMVMPFGKEYYEIKPRERQMAGAVLSMFTRLVDEQNKLDRRLAKERPPCDWVQASSKFNTNVPVTLDNRKQTDVGYYQHREERLLREQERPSAGT